MTETYAKKILGSPDLREKLISILMGPSRKKNNLPPIFFSFKFLLACEENAPSDGPFILFVYPCIYIYLKLMKNITVRPMKEGMDPYTEKVQIIYKLLKMNLSIAVFPEEI